LLVDTASRQAVHEWIKSQQAIGRLRRCGHLRVARAYRKLWQDLPAEERFSPECGHSFFRESRPLESVWGKHWAIAEHLCEEPIVCPENCPYHERPWWTWFKSTLRRLSSGGLAIFDWIWTHFMDVLRAVNPFKGS